MSLMQELRNDHDAQASRVDAAPVPCAARPSTGFFHRDGRCRCFFGGPAPEFAPPVPAELRLSA